MAVEYDGYVGWVRPESQVHLMTGVPLDNTYSKTIYQLSLEMQREWFEPYIVHEWDDLSYIRVNANTIRVNINADEIYTCNYLMFQNTAFSQNVETSDTWKNHWFYCFVSEINYINNNCSEIVYEIDVMQTWHFEYNFGDCLIIREHTATDNLGEHLLQDVSPTGDYLVENYEQLRFSYTGGASAYQLSDLCVLMAICDTDSASEGTTYDGVYSGAVLWAFEVSDVSGIDAKIGEYIQKPDAILNIYMVPRILIPINPPDPELGGSKLGFTLNTTNFFWTGEPIQLGDTINGYEPRCAKLYTYPYCFYGVDNGSGSSEVMPYEYFDDLTPQLRMNGCITSPVTCVARPTNFKGAPVCLNESITLTSYPSCSWNADYYTVWAAQNSVPIEANWTNTTNQIAINDVNNVVQGIGKALSTQLDLVGGIGGIVTGAMQTSQDYEVAKTEIENQVYAASISADIAKGGTNNGCVNCSSYLQGFWGGRYALLPEVLQSIDDYFWMYGYKVNRVDVPERARRHYWNYIQLGSVNITHVHQTGSVYGGIPVDAEAKITQIYQNGITFWMPYDDVVVGDYSQPNGLWGRGAG